MNLKLGWFCFVIGLILGIRLFVMLDVIFKVCSLLDVRWGWSVSGVLIVMESCLLSILVIVFLEFL